MSTARKRKRVLLLIGHYTGIGCHRALRDDPKMRRLFQVVRVWVDYGNNVKNRLYRHSPDPEDEQMIIVEDLREDGYTEDDGNLIKEPFNGETLCKLIIEKQIDIVAVCTFGGLVPLKAINLLKAFLVGHPSADFKLDECLHYANDPPGTIRLPLRCRGAKVMDEVVKSGEQILMRYVLLRGNEKFDDGPIVGMTNRVSSPYFRKKDRGSEKLPWRVLEAQRMIASLAETLFRFNFLRQVCTPAEAVAAGYTLLELVDEQGFSYERVLEDFTIREMRAAGIPIRKDVAKKRKRS